MGELKEYILRKIEEKKKQGVKEIRLSEFVSEIVRETGYSLNSVYNRVRELELEGKIKTVRERGRKKVIVS